MAARDATAMYSNNGKSKSGSAIHNKKASVLPNNVEDHNGNIITEATSQQCTLSGGENVRKRRSSSCQALKHAVLTLYRLDDFHMEKLGSGFFSEVFKVIHKVTGELMVLKMNTNEENRRNMLREVQLMNRMSHSHILKFLGVCVHEGQLHSLTEFINGGNLHDRIMLSKDLSTLTCLQKVQLATDIASGMAYLHSRGVFHRDLTSRNILIHEEQRGEKAENGLKAVVGDFGLATKIPDPNSLEFHLSIVGSPYWMSPECINGQRYDHRADIFSFGIILCELIAGIDADPDILPRTENFGLDYIAYSELAGDCPLHFLYLAFRCCQIDPSKRPLFEEIGTCLQAIIEQQKINSGQATPETASVDRNVGKVTDKCHKLLSKGTPYSRQLKRYSGTSLGFLHADEVLPTQPTAQYVGQHMTKEDLFYTPAPANTNPFAHNAQLREGRKLFAADKEAEHLFDMSMTLPSAMQRSHFPASPLLSLPDAPGIVKKAIAQFNSQIISSQNKRLSCASPDEDSNSDCSSIDSAIDVVSCPTVTLSRQSSRSSCHSRQLNLECAMLFCGLDLIQKYKESPDCSDAKKSTDLESEFHGDLEDVLKSCSSSESWLSLDDLTMSPKSNNGYGEWMYSDSSDPLSSRYLNPMLVEQRKHLRKVETLQKEKLEQLKLKLDQLRLPSSRKSARSQTN